MNKGKQTVAVFVDLRKAFVTVDHLLLIDKLKSIGVNDYLFQRHQTFIFENSKSDTFLVQYGVPQGTNLGPMLFLVYINDMPKALKFSNVIMYADDAVVYLADKNLSLVQDRLTEDMRFLVDWLSYNKWVINLKKSKTESIDFGTAKRLASHDSHSQFERRALLCLSGLLRHFLVQSFFETLQYCDEWRKFTSVIQSFSHT